MLWFPRSKKKGAVCLSGPRPEIRIHELVAIMIVVIPIAIGVPAAAVFVPPAVPLVPAAFPLLTQFVPGVVRLSAVPAVILDGFVESVVRLRDAALASIVFIGGTPGCSRQITHAPET